MGIFFSEIELENNNMTEILDLFASLTYEP